MMNVKYLVGGAAMLLATSALAGGPEQAPAQVAPAADNSGFYINVNGGPNLANKALSWNTWGWNVGGEVGYHFSNNIRLAVASNYWRHNLRNSNNAQFVNLFSNFNMVTVMGNAYYDFDFGSSFVPYVGAGLGWAHTWLNNPTPLKNNFLAFQGIVGVDYKITDNVRLGVNYHLVGFAGNNTQNQFRVRNNLENQFTVGLSYYF